MEKKEKKEKEVKKKQESCECECENCTCENCTCDECCCDECNRDKCQCDKKVETLETEIKELKEKVLKAQAEVINFKRRKEEETSLRLKYCNEDLLREFIGVVDNFERAIKMNNDSLTEETDKFLSGFKIMYTNMLEILKSCEVSEIEVFGKPFDPSVSEALLVEHNGEYDSGVVIEVLQKGYMYKDKVLRPAMVKIND